MLRSEVAVELRRSVREAVELCPAAAIVLPAGRRPQSHSEVGSRSA